MSAPHEPRSAGQTPFPTTSWTLIQKVQKGSEADAARAMEEVCRQYWYPLYAFARRSGFSVHDAEDLTQGLFQSLVTYDSVRAVRAEAGSMRTFMLRALKHTISKKLRHDTAEKRGGEGQEILSIDETDAESRYLREPADKRDADFIFDHAWAEGVLEAARENLRADFAKANNEEDFQRLSEFLPLGDNATPYAEVAAAMGMTESSLRVQIHRMRKRYAKLIESEIAQTVGDPAEQKTELRHLMAVMER